MDKMDKMIAEMTLAKDQYELALNMNIGVAAAKERMKNVAFNYFGELLEIVRKSKDLAAQVDVLNAALEDSDKELAALKRTSSKKKPDADTE